jgi:hypothetical protein
MTLRANHLLTLLTAGLTLFATATAARAEVEEARSNVTPWSGYWFPLTRGGVLESLKKYDQIMGTSHAARWEASYHGSHGAAWEGFCNGWAAASIHEPEPRAPKDVRDARGNRVRLSVGDQKALLAVAHYKVDVSDGVGVRNDNPSAPVNSSNYQDVAPDKLWNYLRSHIQQRGVPIIIDSAANTQVWNYPVYRYQVSWHTDASGMARAHMTLWMADDAVQPDFVGTKPLVKEYDFVCKMRGNTILEGSGKWVGKSVVDHPDFAWYPKAEHSENPQMKYSALVAMLGLRR